MFNRLFTVETRCHICAKRNVSCVYSPPVNPPKEISDINDKKPTNWDEQQRYTDILRGSMSLLNSAVVDISKIVDISFGFA